ncbi:MAG TPA: sirohydrochlorin chelatase [Kamptonema sp.]|nr:sirohydrochlorin chelatase [Kamptonema sp.]
MRSTYLLVAHGSRDPRPQLGLEKLAQLLSERLTQLANSAINPPVVGSCTLEFGPNSLHEQICQFGEYTLSLGLKEVQVLPLFLLPGVHVKEDVPTEVAIAQQLLAQKLTINLRSHLGSQVAGLTDWVAREMASAKTSKWILLSHGSRRTNGNLPVEEIAAKVNAVTAYWSVMPSLEEKVASLVHSGHQKIGIVPYFLFEGGIADAIAQTLQQLKQQFPLARFHLAHPLGASVELSNLILDLIEK